MTMESLETCINTTQSHRDQMDSEASRDDNEFNDDFFGLNPFIRQSLSIVALGASTNTGTKVPIISLPSSSSSSSSSFSLDDDHHQHPRSSLVFLQQQGENNNQNQNNNPNSNQNQNPTQEPEADKPVIEYDWVIMRTIALVVLVFMTVYIMTVCFPDCGLVYFILMAILYSFVGVVSGGAYRYVWALQLTGARYHLL